ncbi:hypothetical protein OHA70_37490 [Kribbella sp. NBC_00382]|uniref:hypothetical protein n=1 Tax=Kribbella sp. NBC_00382 TaxID=2975967 RepID=UPI002E223BB9
MSRTSRRAVALFAIAGTVAAVTSLPAAADERYIGKLCSTVEVDEAGKQFFTVCDTQYDSTSIENHRIHYVTLKPVKCPVRANWWRLRSATNGGTTDTVQEEHDGCATLTTVTSGPKRATTSATITLWTSPLKLTETASFRPL